MRFTVKVIEVVEYEREVIADNFEELKDKVEEDREYVGRCIQSETTQKMYAEVNDAFGRAYQNIEIV